MTLEKLNELCKKYNVPEDVLLLSDSGWECDPTEMDGVWYCKEKNVIVFTQDRDRQYHPRSVSDDVVVSSDYFERLE